MNMKPRPAEQSASHATCNLRSKTFSRRSLASSASQSECWKLPIIRQLFVLGKRPQPTLELLVKGLGLLQ